MTIKLNALLLVLGALLFGIGLVLGLVPMSQSGANCGSAFSPSGDALSSDYTAVLMGMANPDASGQCTDALASRRGISLALLIPGVLLALGGGIVTAINAEKAKHDVGPEASTIH